MTINAKTVHYLFVRGLYFLYFLTSLQTTGPIKTEQNSFKCEILLHILYYLHKLSMHLSSN